MNPLVVTLPIGIALGLVLTFTHRSVRGRGVGAKIGLGVVAGFGVSILLNAVWEVVGLAGGG